MAQHPVSPKRPSASAALRFRDESTTPTPSRPLGSRRNNQTITRVHSIGGVSVRERYYRRRFERRGALIPCDLDVRTINTGHIRMSHRKI